jgi:hypothetical protein
VCTQGLCKTNNLDENKEARQYSKRFVADSARDTLSGPPFYDFFKIAKNVVKKWPIF